MIQCTFCWLLEVQEYRTGKPVEVVVVVVILSVVFEGIDASIVVLLLSMLDYFYVGCCCCAGCEWNAPPFLRHAMANVYGVRGSTQLRVDRFWARRVLWITKRNLEYRWNRFFVGYP
jgi:hypothetical protein